jgi:endonuclease I
MATLRAMFYMDVRYEGTSGEPDLVLTEKTIQISSSTNFMAKLGTLLAWHVADPVSDLERQRNERIYSRLLNQKSGAYFQ